MPDLLNLENNEHFEEQTTNAHDPEEPNSSESEGDGEEKQPSLLELMKLKFKKMK